MPRTRKDQAKHPASLRVTPNALRNISLPVDLDLAIIRIRGGEETSVGPWIETINWADDSAGSDATTSVVMSGSLTARRRAPLDPSSQPLVAGDRIAVRYRDARSHGAGGWKEEVRLQVNEPNPQPKTGVVNFTVTNPFVAFENVEGVFLYRKDHRHRGDWYLHQIIQDACDQVGAPIETPIPRGHVPFPSPFKGDAIGGVDKKFRDLRSPLTSFLAKVLRKEQDLSGRRLMLTVRNGKLAVVEFGAGPRAYRLDLSAQEFEVQTQSDVRPPTVVRATGRVGKGRTSKLKHVEITAPRALAKYGRIVFELNLGRVRDEAELRDRAKRVLANGTGGTRGLRVTRTASTTVQGFPGVSPQDAVVLDRSLGGTPRRSQSGVAPREETDGSLVEFGGPDGVAFVRSRSHTIQGGVWTTQLDLAERDPWLHYRERLAEHQVGFTRKPKTKTKNKSPSKKPASTPKAG